MALHLWSLVYSSFLAGHSMWQLHAVIAGLGPGRLGFHVYNLILRTGLPLQPRLPSSSPPSCLGLLSAGMITLYHRVWSYSYWSGKPEFSQKHCGSHLLTSDCPHLPPDPSQGHMRPEWSLFVYIFIYFYIPISLEINQGSIKAARVCGRW